MLRPYHLPYTIPVGGNHYVHKRLGNRNINTFFIRTADAG
jgi:hypothetical protein